MTAQMIFEQTDWADLWEDAEMVSTLQWIRGNSHLKLGSWRRLFPTEL